MLDKALIKTTSINEEKTKTEKGNLGEKPKRKTWKKSWKM
jgi:hypothetical protein